MLRCKWPSFSSENTALGCGLYFHWFRVPTGRADGQSTPAHSSGLRWFYGWEVSNSGRSFAKDLSNSLKIFVLFATKLQKNEKVFEGLRELFPKSSLVLSLSQSVKSVETSIK